MAVVATCSTQRGLRKLTESGTNIPASERKLPCQEVLAILNASLNVLSTVSDEHLSLVAIAILEVFVAIFCELE